MAAHKNKTTKESARNEQKNGKTLSKAFSSSSTSKSPGNDNLRFTLKLKPEATIVRHSKVKSKFKADSNCVETTSTATSTTNASTNGDVHLDDNGLSRCCCCCVSSLCRKSGIASGEASLTEDTSLLREPLNLSQTNVKQILQCVHNGTVEVKDIVLNECNIIYECKACNNLFRSLANFLSHKRFHCKKHFCEKMVLFDCSTTTFIDESSENHNSSSSFFQSPISEMNRPSSTDNELFTEKEKKSPATRAANYHSFCVQKINGENKRKRKSEFQFKLVRIESNANAVYQKLVNDDEISVDCDNTRVDDLEVVDDSVNIENMKSTTSETHIPHQVPVPVAIKNHCSQSDIGDQLPEVQKTTGTIPKKKISLSIFNKTESKPSILHSLRTSLKPVTTSHDIHVNKAKTVLCSICEASFGSKKTLRVHMKTIHAVKRMIYPCPFCCMTFKQLSNGSRHMIQVHKKNRTQVKNLREVLRSRAYPEPKNSQSSQSGDSDDVQEEEEDSFNDKSIDNEKS